MNKLVLGPLLSFVSNENDKYKVSVLYVVNGLNTTNLGMNFNISDGGNSPETEIEKILDENNYSIIKCTFEVTQQDTEIELEYKFSLDTEYSRFLVPPKKSSPKFAFCSCNGFSSAKEVKKVEHKNNMWLKKSGDHQGLLDEHKGKGFNLLIMGGDQVYADSIWDEVKELEHYQDLSFKEKINFKVSTELETSLNSFYFNLYLKRWRSPELREAFSSIPTIMMWDDHDIFDGFGSYNKELQSSELFKKIFYYAEKYFSIFQKHEKPNTLKKKDYGALQRIGDVGFLTLDLRKNRTIHRVIHEESWDEICNQDYSGLRQLFVISSIPVVHPDMSWIDSAASFILSPSNEDKFELLDDLRDHWNSREHKKERIRLVYNLFKIAELNKTRVTILSGDVHVAAMGIVENKRSSTKSNFNVINQFTSSGIVHPGPPGIMLYFYELLSLKDQEFDRGIVASMLNFPGTKTKFSNKRNWMSFIPSKSKIWANLFVECEYGKYEKAIHNVE